MFAIAVGVLDSIAIAFLDISFQSSTENPEQHDEKSTFFSTSMKK
jgi:hypothetical protein